MQRAHTCARFCGGQHRARIAAQPAGLSRDHIPPKGCLPQHLPGMAHDSCSFSGGLKQPQTLRRRFATRSDLSARVCAGVEVGGPGEPDQLDKARSAVAHSRPLRAKGAHAGRDFAAGAAHG